MFLLSDQLIISWSRIIPLLKQVVAGQTAAERLWVTQPFQMSISDCAQTEWDKRFSSCLTWMRQVNYWQRYSGVKEVKAAVEAWG